MLTYLKVKVKCIYVFSNGKFSYDQVMKLKTNRHTFTLNQTMQACRRRRDVHMHRTYIYYLLHVDSYDVTPRSTHEWLMCKVVFIDWSSTVCN